MQLAVSILLCTGIKSTADPAEAVFALLDPAADDPAGPCAESPTAAVHMPPS